MRGEEGDWGLGRDQDREEDQGKDQDREEDQGKGLGIRFGFGIFGRCLRIGCSMLPFGITKTLSLAVLYTWKVWKKYKNIYPLSVGNPDHHQQQQQQYYEWQQQQQQQSWQKHQQPHNWENGSDYFNRRRKTRYEQ